MGKELEAQISELLAVHCCLTAIDEREAGVVVCGPLSFQASHDRLATITDIFDISIYVPAAYPLELPQVWETGSKIADEYEHVYSDGRLCLAVPIEIRRVFSRQPTLLGFVNRLIVPYLYGYCYWRKHGKHPFGERSHGAEGIVQYYLEELQLGDEVAAMAIIASLFEYGYRGHHACACGSGMIVRRCHGELLRDLYEHHTQESLRIDFEAILVHSIRKFGIARLPFAPVLIRQIVRLCAKRHL